MTTGGRVIHSSHPWAGYIRPWETAGPGSGAWPTANKAFYQPIYIPESCTMTHFVYYGSGASGNVCMALYDSAGIRLVTTGSVAHVGGNSAHVIAANYGIATPGAYFIGCAMDNAVGSMFRYNASIQIFRLAGCFEETSAFPLPATATFAVMSVAYLPMAGISIGTPVFS